MALPPEIQEAEDRMNEAKEELLAYVESKEPRDHNKDRGIVAKMQAAIREFDRLAGPRSSAGVADLDGQRSNGHASSSGHSAAGLRSASRLVTLAGDSVTCTSANLAVVFSRSRFFHQ